MLNKKTFKLVVLISFVLAVIFSGWKLPDLISRWKLSQLNFGSISHWEFSGELEDKLDNHALSFGYGPEFRFVKSLIVDRSDDGITALRFRTEIIQHLGKQNLNETQANELLEIIEKSKRLCLSKEGVEELDEVALKIKQKIHPSHGLSK